MQSQTRYPIRAVAAAGLALLAAACTDRAADQVGPGGGSPVGGTPGRAITLQAVQCRALVAERSVTCGDAPSPTGDGASAIIVGGQNRYVRLVTSNVDYDGAQYSFTLTVRNLIPQPMGTTNAGTLAQDPAGVRVFFGQEPTVAVGTGAISVNNADGTGTFVTGTQPYFQYNTVLEQDEVSAPKTWIFDMPPTVAAFDFVLYVAAPVPYPDGYVQLVGTPFTRSGSERKLTAYSRSAVGNIDSVATFTFSESDPSLAVANDTGLVRGYRAGTVTISANDVSRPERTPVPFSFTVRPIRRTWTGAAGTTAWTDGANWLPDSIAPVSTDTAVIPTGLGVYPLLASNVTLGGLEAGVGGGSGVMLGLQAFNLTVTGDASTTSTTSVTSTSGRLVLSGTARTVMGNVPQLTVNGTYSLTGNLSINRQLRVDAGRLTDGAFRVQVLNN